MLDGALTPDTTKWTNATRAYVEYFGRRLLEVFLPLMQNRSHDKNAAFWMPSCCDHIDATTIGTDVKVVAKGGRHWNVRELFAAWYSRNLTEQDPRCRRLRRKRGPVAVQRLGGHKPGAGGFRSS